MMACGMIAVFSGKLHLGAQILHLHLVVSRPLMVQWRVWLELVLHQALVHLVLLGQQVQTQCQTATHTACHLQLHILQLHIPHLIAQAQAAVVVIAQAQAAVVVAVEEAIKSILLVTRARQEQPACQAKKPLTVNAAMNKSSRPTTRYRVCHVMREAQLQSKQTMDTEECHLRPPLSQLKRIKWVQLLAANIRLI